MGRVINFGAKKEQFEEAKHAAELAVGSALSAMEKRKIILHRLRKCAREAAQDFAIECADEMSSYAIEIVTSVLLSVEGASDLFSEIEVTILQRAFFETIHSERQWLDLHEQRYKS